MHVWSALKIAVVGIILLIDPKNEPETEKTYCLYYLENTKIVVGFEQVPNKELN